MWIPSPEKFKTVDGLEDICIYGALAVQTLHSVASPVNSSDVSEFDVWGYYSPSKEVHRIFERKIKVDFNSSLVTWSQLVNRVNISCPVCPNMDGEEQSFFVEGYLRFELPLSQFRGRDYRTIFESPSNRRKDSYISIISCMICGHSLLSCHPTFLWKSHGDEWAEIGGTWGELSDETIDDWMKGLNNGGD